MKIPYFLPVRYDLDNETIDDAKGNVLYICNWANSGLDKADVKDRALHTVKLLNGELSHQKTEDYFDAVAVASKVVTVENPSFSESKKAEDANLPLKKKPGRPKK